MTKTVLVCFTAFLFLSAAAGAADWKLSSSVTFDTGKYGTKDRTNTLYIPFTLKRYYSEGEVSVTVPFVRQSATGLVTSVGGVPVRAARPARSSSTGSAESGLGDVLVHGLLTLKTEKPDAYDLALAGKLKLPTADKNKGLGTGAPDEGVGLEFGKKIAGRWALLVDAYYTLIGEPAGTTYNDQLAFDIGFYRAVAKDLWLTALYETSSAIVPGNPDPRDVSCSLEYKAADGNHYFGGLLLGLSDGSPDIGVTAGVSRRF